MTATKSYAKILIGNDNYSEVPFAGMHITEAANLLNEYDWAGCWPVCDSDGTLTGEVLGTDEPGYTLCSWDGDSMIPGDNDLGLYDAWVEM